MQVTPVPAFDDNYIWVLHGASRADFAIVGGMGDTTERLNKELMTRSKTVSAKNDTLEQAVKTELTLDPDYNRDYKNKRKSETK